MIDDFRLDISISLSDMEKPGVYIWEREGKALYIGQSRHVIHRLGGHHCIKPELVKDGDRLLIRFTESSRSALALEKQLIEKFRPQYNIKCNVSEARTKLPPRHVPMFKVSARTLDKDESNELTRMAQQMHQERMSLRYIARYLGVNIHTAAKLVKGHRMKWRGPIDPARCWKPNPRDNQIYEMRQNGETLQAIATRFGMTRENVRLIVSRY